MAQHCAPPKTNVATRLPRTTRTLSRVLELHMLGGTEVGKRSQSISNATDLMVATLREGRNHKGYVDCQ